MNQNELSEHLYKRFNDLRSKTSFSGEYMPYGWENIPGPVSALWIPYSLMLQEFAPEIANAINQLTGYVHRLKTWESIIGTLKNDEKFHAIHEFIDPISTVALNLPYVIRSRFLFASAHLCHQANKSKDDKWKDDLPLDGEIVLEIADKYGRGWKKYTKFKQSLEKIANKKHRDITGNFRNLYSHRFSPHIEIGISQMVTRTVSIDRRKVSYEIGEKAPLLVGDIVEELHQQCLHCYEAFERFQKLIEEQQVAIANAHAS